MGAPRTALLSDKQQLKNLWRSCFEDSNSFLNWFFDYHFSPCHSVLVEEDGQIVSAMHSLPLFIKIRDKILPCAILSGFSTLQHFRGRGYMKSCFGYMAENLRQMDILLLPHTPAVLESYYSLGHFPAADTAYVEIPKVFSVSFPKNIIFVDLLEDVSILWGCYHVFSHKYSGILSRSIADMKLKCADYNADGGKCIAYIENGRVSAYGIFYEREKYIHGEEIVSLSHSGEEKIVTALMSIAKGKKLFIKLPPDSLIQISNSNKTVKPKGVMGLLNASAVLRELGRGLDYAFIVKDNIIAKNNGCFNMRGEAVPIEDAQLELEAGHLIQFLMGYHSLSELSKQQKIKIFDDEAVQKLDILFPKQSCFIIDEY